MNIGELEKLLKDNALVIKENMKIQDNPIMILKEKENKTMIEKNQRKSKIKKIAVGIAGAAASFVLVMNFIPNLAKASLDVPVFGNIVNVVTFGRYEVKSENVKARVETPQIKGLLDKELENKLNTEFKENSTAVILAFEKDIEKLQKEFGDDFHLGVEASYTVRTNNEQYLVIDTYIVNTVASSSTKHSFYNIDKKANRIVELKDMFDEGADYITVISDYIVSEMKKQNDLGTGAYWIGNSDGLESFERIKEDQNFYINDNGNVVICFDKYEVAPGAYGCPEFEIPEDIFA